MQFSAIVNRFIVKTLLNSTLTNDLKKKKKNRKMFIVADLVSLNIYIIYLFAHCKGGNLNIYIKASAKEGISGSICTCV